MVLIKNTKSKIKRIGMNMAVYGFASAFVLMMFATFLPEIIPNNIYVLMAVSALVAISGLIISAIRIALVGNARNKKTKKNAASEDIIKEGKLIDKESGTNLNKEVVLWKMPLDRCRGDAEPTCFVINIFADKVEIKWGVGWRGGISHADGVGGTEILEADYFEENTIDDFVMFLNETHWGKEFVKWFDIKKNEKIINLFRGTTKPLA